MEDETTGEARAPAPTVEVPGRYVLAFFPLLAGIGLGAWLADRYPEVTAVSSFGDVDEAFNAPVLLVATFAGFCTTAICIAVVALMTAVEGDR